MHLRLPGLRRLFDGITIVPIVIPPIVLIIGVLQVAPTFLKSTPYLLALEYAILAMPFVYRSLDAGLRAIDLKTLVEASRSLGGRWGSTLWRVVVPNLRSGLLSATVLTVALVLGEFTMASLDLFQTLPVWIYNFAQDDGQRLHRRLAVGTGRHLGRADGRSPRSTCGASARMAQTAKGRLIMTMTTRTTGAATEQARGHGGAARTAPPLRRHRRPSTGSP